MFTELQVNDVSHVEMKPMYTTILSAVLKVQLEHSY